MKNGLRKWLKNQKQKQTKNFIDLELSINISNKIDGEKLFYLAYEVSKYFRLSYKNNKIHIILDTVKLEEHFIIYLTKLFSRILNEMF